MSTIYYDLNRMKNPNFYQPTLNSIKMQRYTASDATSIGSGTASRSARYSN